MVKVVVSFAHSHQSGQHVIPWRSPVVEWLLADPVRETVHTKGSLLYEARPDDARIHKATPPVSPAQTCYHRREDPGSKEKHFSIVPVLKHNDRVAVQIGDVRTTFDFRVVVKNHPTDVRKQQASHNRVWIFHRICPSVMRAMVGAPPSYATLDCSCSCKCQEQTYWKARRVAAVAP
jgi:hypothetical protein